MADWLTAKQRSRNMAAIRSSGTRPELVLRRAIALACPRRKVIDRPDLFGKPDFFLPGLKLALFADGCFWHGCRAHGRTPEDNYEYWVRKLERNRVRDRVVTRTLRSQGLTVVRLWEHDLSKGPQRAARLLTRKID